MLRVFERGSGAGLLRFSKQEVNFKIELNFYIVVINIVYMTLHYHLYVIDLSQDILKPI